MVKGLPDATRVVFDEERVVANAGVVLPAVLAERLGIGELVDESVGLVDSCAGANAGRKVMTLLSAMVLGADCIDDCDILRSGQTRAVLGHGVAAPSTLGTFLPEFRSEAVAMVRSGRPVPEVAEALGVSQQSLRNWVKQEALDRRERDDGLTSAERDELRTLRRENARLKQERDLLKRAAAFFARDSDQR